MRSCIGESLHQVILAVARYFHSSAESKTRGSKRGVLDEWFRQLSFSHNALRTKLLKMSAFHLPHAILVRLHGHKINIVILTPETAGTVGV